MKRIAVILTNYGQYGIHEEKTGLWLAEATEFVNVVTQAGYAVDYISPLGGKVPLDPRSLKRLYVKEADRVLWESSDFIAHALRHSKPVAEVNADDYIAIYYTGGHGVLWDFPDNVALQTLAMRIYANNGYVTSVCHGVAGLLNLKDEQGNFFIQEKRVTGFTDMEEILSGKHKWVPFSTEQEAKKRGAHFVKKLPFMKHAIQDGRVITGQNPMSGGAVAQRLVAALKA